jgi:hypothetical protein
MIFVPTESLRTTWGCKQSCQMPPQGVPHMACTHVPILPLVLVSLQDLTAAPAVRARSATAQALGVKLTPVAQVCSQRFAVAALTDAQMHRHAYVLSLSWEHVFGVVLGSSISILRPPPKQQSSVHAMTPYSHHCLSQ